MSTDLELTAPRFRETHSSTRVATAAGHKPYTWHYVLSIFLRHRREIVVANTVAIIAAALSVPVPLLMPLLVDEVLLDKPGNMLAALNALIPQSLSGPTAYIAAVLVITIVLRLASMVLQVWQTRQFSLVAKDLIYRMRCELIARLERVSMSEYETLGSSTVASHLVVDLNTVDEFTGVTVSRLLIAVLTLIGAAAVLMWIHWPLGVFILVMNPVSVYFTLVISKRVKELKRRENKALQIFQEALSETLDAIHQIRAANRERHYLGRVIDLASDIRSHSAAYSWKSDAANRMSFVVFLIGIDAFRAVAMLMVIFSDLSLGRMIAVFGYLWFMLGPIETILGLQYAYQSATAALDRINSLFELKDEPRYAHRVNPFEQRRANSLELLDLRFRYGDGPLVLDGLELAIAAGEQIAIVGASGGGKSTLVQIILGLYTPASGEVLFDGVPVNEIGLDVVREHVGTVLQHPALLHASVRENLTLGRAFGDDALWEALEVAQLKDVIIAQHDGLETVIGRSGVRLSGGQRQRLAIARMLLCDPNVAILDEATSALDVVTETRVHEALHERLSDRTMIVVAHRLSAVRRANRVLVLEAGTVAEEGAHDELIRKQGLYARLYGKAQAP